MTKCKKCNVQAVFVDGVNLEINVPHLSSDTLCEWLRVKALQSFSDGRFRGSYVRSSCCITQLCGVLTCRGSAWNSVHAGLRRSLKTCGCFRAMCVASICSSCSSSSTFDMKDQLPALMGFWLRV